MAVKYKMDEEARDNLDRRVRTGNECIDVAAGFTIPEESDENETYARDAVSHILTALFGPAGYSVWEADPNYSAESGVRFKEIALDEERGTLARTFLDMAYESWEGDAEDYTATAVTVDNPLLPKTEADDVLTAEEFTAILRGSQDDQEFAARVRNHFNCDD